MYVTLQGLPPCYTVQRCVGMAVQASVERERAVALGAQRRKRRRGSVSVVGCGCSAAVVCPRLCTRATWTVWQ